MYVVNYIIDLCLFLQSLAYPSFVSFVFGICYFLTMIPDWYEQLKILQLASCGEEEECCKIEFLWKF